MDKMDISFFARLLVWTKVVAATVIISYCYIHYWLTFGLSYFEAGLSDLDEYDFIIGKSTLLQTISNIYYLVL